MKGSEFVCDYVHLLYSKCLKSPINKKDKCFQYVVTVALNHKEIKKGLQRITKIRPFINKYMLEGINPPSEKVDWKKIEKNNVTIPLNIL